MSSFLWKSFFRVKFFPKRRNVKYDKRLNENKTTYTNSQTHEWYGSTFFDWRKEFTPGGTEYSGGHTTSIYSHLIWSLDPFSRDMTYQNVY